MKPSETIDTRSLRNRRQKSCSGDRAAISAPSVWSPATPSSASAMMLVLSGNPASELARCTDRDATGAATNGPSSNIPVRLRPNLLQPRPSPRKFRVTFGRMAEDLQSAATELLQRLIRFNTVNPPGDERAGPGVSAGRARASRLRLRAARSHRPSPNLVARLDGAADGPTLCLLSHVDTVLATPSDWTHDPWSGDLDDGFVWGRGALDMKSQTAAEVAAAISLVRSGWRPARGTLLVVCVVDEETGGAEGAQWLTATHPDKVRCDMLVNEGGGGILEYEGRRLYCLGCAEKGVFRFALTTARRRRPCVDAPPRRQRPAQDGATARPARRPDSPTTTSAPSRAPSSRRSASRPTETSTPCSTGSAPQSPAWSPLLEPMMGVSLAPTRISRLGEDQRDSGRRPPPGRLPRPARTRRGADARADPRGPRRRRLSASSSPSR